MRYVGLLGMLAVVLAMPAGAAQKRTTFGVGATVSYNCAMDMSKLTPEQRKAVEDYCRAQGNQQNSAQQTGK